jgi:hypothetical protein
MWVDRDALGPSKDRNVAAVGRLGLLAVIEQTWDPVAT